MSKKSVFLGKQKLKKAQTKKSLPLCATFTLVSGVKWNCWFHELRAHKFLSIAFLFLFYCHLIYYY